MSNFINIISRIFDSGENDFNEELSESPASRELEKYIRSAAIYYSDSRVLRLRSKLVWFSSGCALCLGLFAVVVSQVDWRISLAETLYPAEYRLRYINAFLRQDTSDNESAERVKTTLREILLDQEFQKEMVIENIRKGEHKNIGFSNFPKMGNEDIWVALGTGHRENFKNAFKDGFIEYLKQEYSVEIQQAFHRAKKISQEAVKKVVYELGKSNEVAVLKLMPTNATRSQCGNRIDHRAYQVELALPRDIWMMWKNQDSYLYLQCRDAYIPQIELTISGEFGAIHNVELVGIVPSEDKKDFEKRVNASGVTKSTIDLKDVLNKIPIEARVTKATADALGMSENDLNYDSVITFSVSKKWFNNL